MGGSGISEKMQKRVDSLGIWGSLLLGVVFALSFCPTSAALFFGSLIPLSVQADSSIVLPSIYGCRHRAAGVDLRGPDRVERPIGRQRVQPPDANRMVGTTDYRRDLPCRGAVLFVKIHFRVILRTRTGIFGGIRPLMSVGGDSVAELRPGTVSSATESPPTEGFSSELQGAECHWLCQCFVARMNEACHISFV